MEHRSLFIDETGKSQFSHPSKHFILSACSIPTNKLIDIRNIADQIIFKYWGTHKSYYRKFKEDKIVFHAKDIHKNKGIFSIFKSEQKLKQSFWNDLYSCILSRRDVNYLIAYVDKNDFRKRHPAQKAEYMLDVSYKKIIELFLSHLIGTNSVGEIISESSSDQDFALVKALSYYQRNSLKVYNSSLLVNTKITRLSLINKHDNNIGAQIADLMAWTGALKHSHDHGSLKRQLRFEETKLLNLLNRRLASSHSKYNQYVEL